MKKTSAILALILVLAGMAVPLWSQEKGKTGLKNLSPRHRDWLEKEVIYIISDKERDVFLRLGNDRERDIFIEAFWRQRDPTPGTPANEFKEEHYRRIVYANEYFSRDTTRPGWMTDRGRIHILLGPPRDISRFEGESYVYPTVIWSYTGRAESGLPANFDLVFFKKGGTGEYILYSPSQDGPLNLLVNYRGDPTSFSAAYEQLRKFSPRLAEVSLSLIPGEGHNDNQPSLASDMLISSVLGLSEKAVDSKYAEALLKYKDIIEVDYSANYIESDSLVSVIRDGSGMFFVHYAVQPARLSLLSQGGKASGNFALNGIVKDAEGRLIFQYDRSFPFDIDQSQVENVRKTGLLMADAVPLAPGQYSFNLLIKNTISKEFTSVEKNVAVPKLGPAEFRMSPLLLGYRLSLLPALPRQIKPFRIGDVQISCQPGRSFSSKEAMAVFFQVFNMPDDLKRTGRADFVFERQGREFWRSTVPLNDLPATDIIREFPLQTFPADYYKLRVALVDSQNRTTVAAEADFEISPLTEVPRPWVIAKIMPPADNAMYAFLLGGQLVRAGDAEGGGALLAKAYQANPHMLDYALAHAEQLIRTKNFAKAREVLRPFAQAEGENHEALALLGACSQSLGQHREAIVFYRTYLDRAGMKLDILNAIGECYFALGDLEQARAAWERSLAISPQQDHVRESLDRIKKKQTPLL